MRCSTSTTAHPRRRTDQWLDIVDAAALSGGCRCSGVDVNERAERLADDVEALLGRPVYVFNELARGDGPGARRPTVRDRAVGASTRRHAVGPTGSPPKGRAHPARGICQLRRRPLRPGTRPAGRHPALAARRGGSHAQRDIIDLNLLATAARAGRRRRAKPCLPACRRKPTRAGSSSAPQGERPLSDRPVPRAPSLPRKRFSRQMQPADLGAACWSDGDHHRLRHARAGRPLSGRGCRTRTVDLLLYLVQAPRGLAHNVAWLTGGLLAPSPPVR